MLTLLLFFLVWVAMTVFQFVAFVIEFMGWIIAFFVFAVFGAIAFLIGLFL